MIEHNNEQRLLAEAFYALQGLKLHWCSVDPKIPTGSVTNLKGQIVAYHESLEFFWVGKSIEVGIQFKSMGELVCTKVKFEAQEIK